MSFFRAITILGGSNALAAEVEAVLVDPSRNLEAVEMRAPGGGIYILYIIRIVWNFIPPRPPPLWNFFPSARKISAEIKQ